MNRKGILLNDAKMVEIARNVKHSTKGELDITDVNLIYRHHDQLNVEVMGSGTHDSQLVAGQFVATLEKRQGTQSSVPGRNRRRSGWLTDAQLEVHAHKLGKSVCGEYLQSLLSEAVITRSKR